MKRSSKSSYSFVSMSVFSRRSISSYILRSASSVVAR